MLIADPDAGRNARLAQVALAVWLAGVAGAVDAVGYRSLARVFVAHMTGNTDALGQQLGAGNLAGAEPLLVAVGVFVSAIAATTVGLELAGRRRLRSAMAAALLLEGCLVAVFMLLGAAVARHGRIPAHGGGFYGCLVVAVAAMGVQTAAVTKWGRQTIRTTYLSGMLTRLGQSLARLALGGDAEGTDRRELAARAAVYSSLWVAFVAAAALATFLYDRFALWSLGLPLAALVVAAAAAAVTGRNA